MKVQARYTTAIFLFMLAIFFLIQPATVAAQACSGGTSVTETWGQCEAIPPFFQQGCVVHSASYFDACYTFPDGSCQRSGPNYLFGGCITTTPCATDNHAGYGPYSDTCYISSAPPPPGGPPPGPPPPGGPPPPPPPTYNVTGVVFRDFNKDNSQSTRDAGVRNVNLTMAGDTQVTNSSGKYGFYGYLAGNYTVTANNDICGWYYPSNSKSANLNTGDKTVNFSLWPNGPANLVVQRFELRDSSGVEKNVWDSGEKAYAYVSIANNGTDQPYAKEDVIQGAINMDKSTAWTSTSGIITISNPDYFYFQRNLCWNGGGVNYQVGSYPSSSNASHFPKRTYATITNTPGSYTARAFFDFNNHVDEGGTTATEITDNQYAYPYTVRSYTVTGSVFVDTDGDGNKDVGEPLYAGTGTYVTDSLGTRASVSSGNFTLSNRRGGSRTLRYTPPKGYVATTGSFSVNLTNGGSTVSPCTTTLPQGPACSTASNTTIPPPTVTKIYFGISPVNVWMQTQGLNARFDSGPPQAQIPASANVTYGRFMMRSATNSAGITNFYSPGILFTGDNAPPSNISAAEFGWQAGGTTYPESYDSTRFPLKTSYDYLIKKLASQAVELRNATGGCQDYLHCDLNPLSSGIYKADGTVKINVPLVLSGNTKITLLVNGSFATQESIKVITGSVLLVSASNDIIVESNVGQPYVAQPATPYTFTRAGDLNGGVQGGLEGLFVAGNDVRINSRGACGIRATEDEILYIDGALVANSLGKGGKIDNQRSLCATDAYLPTLIVRPRIDMLLSFPDYAKSNTFIWKEVAP